MNKRYHLVVLVLEKLNGSCASLTLNLPSSRGCVGLREKLAPKPHCALAITKNLSASTLTLHPHAVRSPTSTPLCAVEPLYNPHSRN